MLDIDSQFNGDDDNHTRVGRYLHEIETNFVRIKTTGIVFIANCIQSQDQTGDPLQSSKNEPSKEFEVGEKLVLLTDVIHLRIVRIENLLLVHPLAQLMEGLLCRFKFNIDLKDSP